LVASTKALDRNTPGDVEYQLVERSLSSLDQLPTPTPASQAGPRECGVRWHAGPQRSGPARRLQGPDPNSRPPRLDGELIEWLSSSGEPDLGPDAAGELIGEAGTSGMHGRPLERVAD
jgi:hypothetical protein